MRVSELRQIHQREVGTQSGRRSYNTATMTQMEKHSILMGLVDGEAYTALRDHFRAELDKHAFARELMDRRNRAREDDTQERWERLHDAYLREVDRLDAEVAARAAAEIAAQRAREEAGLLTPVVSASFAPAAPATPVVYPVPVEPIHRVPPKLSAPDIPDIMDRAWAFLERTFKEVTPELEKAYMFFDYKAGRSTLITLSDLEELCRLTNKPVEGRAVVAKAINALRRELQRHLEREQLLWLTSMLTLAHMQTRVLEIEEALRASELELAPLALAKAANGVQQLTVESKPRESAPVGEKRPRETHKERRQRGKEPEKGQAYAVTAPVAANKPAFSGNCHNCGKAGHMKVNCTEKKPAGSGRKPGAVCNFCKKVDSHTEDECWEKNLHMKPDKWRKRDAEAKPAYVAKTLTPSAPPAAEMEQPGFTAWTVATTTNCLREAFAVFADEGPELRPTTMEQRDTTPAARAKGEAERRAARAKEDRVRLGGPPPGFRPQGERRAAEGPESPPAAPEVGRRRGQPTTAAPVAAANAVPPGFGEYAPEDPHYVGLTDAEQSGVRLELLSAPDRTCARGGGPEEAAHSLHG
jgi:hypothetical protein